MILTRKNTREEVEWLSSRSSAWRLFTFRIDKIDTLYHVKKCNINFENVSFSFEKCYKIAASAVLKIIEPTNFYFDDIVSEGILRFLENSGNCGTSGALWSVARYTCYDFLKKRLFKEAQLNQKRSVK